MTAFDRCHCRPSCLARVTPDDEMYFTDSGYVLREHLDPADAYPQETLFDIAGQAS